MNEKPSDTISADEPARREIDAFAGAQVIEFGTDWCEHCQAAQPLIALIAAAIRLRRWRDEA